jgi:hypothetical protein
VADCPPLFIMATHTAAFTIMGKHLILACDCIMTKYIGSAMTMTFFVVHCMRLMSMHLDACRDQTAHFGISTRGA